MSLHRLEEFSALAARLPGTGMVDQWQSHVAKVGGKVFALLDAEGSGVLVFKVPETSFEILSALPGIGQAAYFAKRQWVSVAPGALGEDELEAYLLGSYRMVAGRLTRKARAEIAGLEAYLSSPEASTA